jgi:hypothetical protein
MSGFSAEWLSLREPYDVRARNPVVLKAVIDAFKSAPNLRILDLGCGSGSTLRTLAPRLEAAQNWRLVDHDPGLLARAAESAMALNVPARAVSADLNSQLESLLETPADLVTMSALLDLVSNEWLERFADRAAERRLHVYAALTYDGRIEMMPAHPLDNAIVDALNLHQGSDKGFGPALGPLAGAGAIAKLMQRGLVVVQGSADWLASQEDAAFQSEISRGWASAARETGVLAARDVDDWVAFRDANIAAGRASLRVGHVDFFAVPPAAA